MLSLADAGFPNGKTAVVLIDIGCGPESLSWMKDRGVQIVPFNPALIPQTIMSVIQPVQRAQAVRPWLPELLPQFQHFVWLDCDTWVQNGEFMGQMIAGANAAPDAVMLAPAHSHYHARVYLELHEILGDAAHVVHELLRTLRGQQSGVVAQLQQRRVRHAANEPDLGALASGGRVPVSGHVGAE